MNAPNGVPKETPDTPEARVRRWIAGELRQLVWPGWNDGHHQRADVRAVLGALEDRVRHLERHRAGLLACGEEP